MRRDGDAGGCICVCVGRDIGDEGAVGLLRVVADFEIAAGRVVGFHAAGRDPFQIAMRGDRGVGFIQVRVDIGVAWVGVRLRAVGEVVYVFRTDDVHEVECGLTARQRLSLTLSRHLGLGRLGRG